MSGCLPSHVFATEAFLKKVETVLKKQVNSERKSIGLFNLGPLENKLFGIDNGELGASFMKRWWSVDPEVIDYVQFRPAQLKKDLSHVIEIARYILCAEGIPDGLLSIQGSLTPEYVQKKVGITPEAYQLLTEDFVENLNAFA